MKALLIATVFIFLFTLPAEGSKWLEAVKSADGDSFLVDVESIEDTKIDTIRIWTKLIYREPKYLEGRDVNIAYVVTHEEHDCEEGKTRDIKIIFFNKDAAVLHTSSELTPWRYPPPGTVMIEVHRYICKFKDRFHPLIPSNKQKRNGMLSHRVFHLSPLMSL